MVPGKRAALNRRGRPHELQTGHNGQTHKKQKDRGRPSGLRSTSRCAPFAAASDGGASQLGSVAMRPDPSPSARGWAGRRHARRTSGDGRCCSTRSHLVERNDGKTGSRRALRARAGSRRGRRGPPVLQAPLLGAADRKCRDCPGVRRVRFEVPETSISAAAAMRLTQLPGEPQSTLAGPAHAATARRCRAPIAWGMELHENTGLPGIAMPASAAGSACATARGSYLAGGA